MSRAGVLDQVRRILLLACGPQTPEPSRSQLELSFWPEARKSAPAAGLDEISDRAHALVLELVLLTQMEVLGLVASPLRAGGRPRMGLGSGPPLRFLGEWENSAPVEDAPWRLGTPSAGREQAYAEGLGRVRALVEAAELPPSRIREIARRLYLLVPRLGPEDDLPGTIHAHGLRNTAHSAPSGRLSFRPDTAKGRGHGAVLTPPDLALELASILLDAGGCGGGTDLLDPACGTGAFLIAAVRRHAEGQAAAPAPGPGAGSAKACAERLSPLRHAYGVDLDPRAARLAAINLSHWAALEAGRSLRERRGAPTEIGPFLDQLFGPGYPYFLGSQIQVGNALQIEASPLSPGFLWEKRFPAIFRRPRPGFDVVLGNPPWVSYGLRERAAAPDEERLYYERLYPAGTQYKLTLYPLFMELALRLCRDGGCHGFLVPDSVLAGHHFSRIRKLLLTSTDLIELTLVEAGVFPAVHVGHTLLYAVRKKGADVPAPPTVRNRVLNGRRDPVKGAAPAIRIPAAQYTSSGSAPLRIYRDESEMLFLARMHASPYRFQDVAWSYSGLIARYGQKTIQRNCASGSFPDPSSASAVADGGVSSGAGPRASFAIRDRLGREVYRDDDAARQWHRALLGGGEVHPYRTDWGGGEIYFPADRDALGKVYKSGFDLQRYDGPKLFLRQTGDRLVAAVDRTGLFCLNNLHLVGGLDRSSIPPLALAGVLMSRPVQKAFQISTQESARPLAQVDLKAVEVLPYPCDPTGAPLCAAPGPPRSSPQARRILRAVTRILESATPLDLLEMCETACTAGAGAFEGGPLSGRDAFALLFLGVLEARESEAAASAGPRRRPGRPGAPAPVLPIPGVRARRGRRSMEAALQEVIDEMVDLLFRRTSAATV